MGSLTPKRFLATSRRVVPGRSGTAANRIVQRGSSLFIALIVLVAMTLAAISLVRSVDTANVIAGNFAFKQGAIQAGDLGVEAAFTQLPTIITNSLETAVTPAASSTDPNYWYYPTMRELDVNGAPTTKELGATGTATAIDWNDVPVAATSSGYSVQYVMDRLCQGPPPVTDIEGKCFADPGAGGGTKKAGGVVFSGNTIVYYRVTMRVSGPRNTVSMMQAILSR